MFHFETLSRDTCPTLGRVSRASLLHENGTTLALLSPMNEDLQTWIENWAQDNGSAVDLWGSEAVQARLRALVSSGARIKSAASKFSQMRHVRSGEWTLLAEEQNGDSYEAILFQ